MAEARGKRGCALGQRFVRHLEERGWLEDHRRFLVALSGGIDSVVLLHLLRFAARLPASRVVVAHFDHGWRVDSPADSRWVRGLAAAWGVAVTVGRTEKTLHSEEEARLARYRFLERTRVEVGADVVLTAHHADDQAETILFRLLRGTGVEGLTGIAETREPALVRPLLPFWREEIEGYAAAHAISYRDDQSNRDLSRARNTIRHRVLPQIEASFAPGARRALVRLGALAAQEHSVFESTIAGVLDALDVRRSPKRVVLSRAAVNGLHESLQGGAIRALADDLGVRLDRTGTERAVAFLGAGRSGTSIDLTGGLRMARDFDVIVLSRGEVVPAIDSTLTIPGTGPGQGEVVVGGTRFQIQWSQAHAPEGDRAEYFDPDSVHFPLLVRGWAPGDRIRLKVGSRKLKKVFGDDRIPLRERHCLPLLVEHEDQVLWVPGIVRSVSASAKDVESQLCISVSLCARPET